MEQIREFANETAKLVDLGIKLQHFGMDSLFSAVKETLCKSVVEPLCRDCQTILTEEEEEHCGDLCFDCAERTIDETMGDWKHPDQQD